MTIAAWYLFSVMLLMAAGQLASGRAYVDAIARFRLGPALPIAALLLALELATILLLPFDATRMAGAIAGLAGAVLWTMLAVVAYVLRRPVTNCACFGRFLPQPLRWWVLLEDAAFVALATWVLVQVA